MIAINNWVGVYVSYFFPYTGHCTDVVHISQYELKNVWELSELWNSGMGLFIHLIYNQAAQISRVVNFSKNPHIY